MICQRCKGNGEIVADWDRYLHPGPDDPQDAGVAECPDCDGTGEAGVLQGEGLGEEVPVEEMPRNGVVRARDVEGLPVSDEAAIRAAVLGRLERRGFAPERPINGDAAPDLRPGILDPLATAVCASAVAWLVWHGLFPDPMGGTEPYPVQTLWTRAWAVVFGLVAAWGWIAVASRLGEWVGGVAAGWRWRAGDGEGRDG